MKKWLKIAALLLVALPLGWLVFCQHKPAESIRLRSNSPNSYCELRIDLVRADNHLAWSVKNSSDSPLWVFLLLPSVSDDSSSVSIDRFYIDSSLEGTIVLRKTYNLKTTTVATDSFERSGALLLYPGEVRRGSLLMDLAMRNQMFPKQTSTNLHGAFSVIVEVGWIPSHESQVVEHSTAWVGGQFAYVNPEMEPGGQRFCRSAPFFWND